jgi:hypothetical protein
MAAELLKFLILVVRSFLDISAVLKEFLFLIFFSLSVCTSAS